MIPPMIDQGSNNNNNLREAKLKVRFFGPMIGIVGKSQEQLFIEKNKEFTTVEDVIIGLCEKFDGEFREIALRNGEVNPGLVIFVNGAHVLDPKQRVLVTDEMQIMIASQMKGG